MAGLFQSVINCFQKPRECGLDSASLKKQDASTSAAIISLLEEDAEFVALSKFEGESIVGRDNEDAEKLQKGVDASIAKGASAAPLQPKATQEVGSPSSSSLSTSMGGSALTMLWNPQANAMTQDASDPVEIVLTLSDASLATLRPSLPPLRRACRLWRGSCRLRACARFSPRCGSIARPQG